MMKSVVDMAPQVQQNSKMLNMTLIGFGKKDSVYRFLQEAKNRIIRYTSAFPVVLYSEAVLAAGESEPEKLNKNATIRLSKDTFSRRYYGFLDSTTVEKRYRHLYVSKEHFLSSKCGYYSRQALTRVIHQRFDSEPIDPEDNFCDLEIRFTYEMLDNGEAFAEVIFRVRDAMLNSGVENEAVKLRDMIEDLDSNCPDALSSAYVSVGFPIAHTRIYPDYDSLLCQNHILGAEWYVYVNRRIHPEFTGIEAYVERLKNGFSYTAKVPINDFRVTDFDGVLDELLVPAVGIYSWSELCCGNWRLSYLPKFISVFYDPWSPTDPTVVLSNTTNIEEYLQEHDILIKNRMDMFVIK